MPSLQSLKDVTTPVPVTRGDVTVVLQAALEKVSVEDPAWKALFVKGLKLTEEATALAAERNDHIQSLVAPKNEPAKVFEFRDFVSALIDSVRDGSADAGAAAEKVKAFEGSLFPDEGEFEKRRKKVEAALEKVNKKIDENSTAQYRNLAERVAYLVPKWDVTETDAADSPMVPVTADNLMGFSSTIIQQMLLEVEKKVRGL